MRRTRAHFKRALRLCRANEAQNRADALSDNLRNNNVKFWKNIQSLSPKSNTTAQRIGDAVGEEAISNFWADHFDSILNCVDDRESKDRVNDLLAMNNPIEDRFSPGDIEIAIKQLAGNKAVGCDGLPAEAYKFAHCILHELLAALYNACLLHRFLPESLLLIHLIPLIKNKLKDHSDPGNYRPIAITTISSKLLESLLLVKLHPFLNTTDNQFGFKANHSTDACIYLLKEIINFYTTSGSSVFLCFVDVRKAFDRVNYNKLFLKLHNRGTPLHIIGLLSFWFNTQQFCVSWGNTLSRSFGSANGLRQGGVLSPHLFNLYTDSLNLQLNALPIGCLVNGLCINNLCYADDMVLISPSASGLQSLIDCCCNYAADHDIIYNETKTQCMRITSNPHHFREPTIFLGQHRLQFVTQFPYLGHIITNDLKDDADIEHRRRKLCALGNMITRRFAFCNRDTKLTLFRSFCYSVYGSHLWANYRSEPRRRIKVTHNDILRRLTNTPRSRNHSASAMFAACNLRTLKEIIRHSMSSLICRLQRSTNSIITNVLVSGARPVSRIWQIWEREAFVT